MPLRFQGRRSVGEAVPSTAMLSSARRRMGYVVRSIQLVHRRVWYGGSPKRMDAACRV